MNIESCAFLVGFFGDFFLQVLSKSPDFDFGLKKYFEVHGKAEALFIAGGMMTLFYILYSLTGLPLKWQYIAVYGILLDILFRVYNIFPSLKWYYSALSPFWTCLWEAIAMVLPLILFNLFSK